MSFVIKYKAALQEKIRYIEEGTTLSVKDATTYAQSVGHKLGLLDALTIFDQALGETAEPEDTYELEDDEKS